MKIIDKMMYIFYIMSMKTSDDDSQKLAFISRSDKTPLDYNKDESRFFFGDLNVKTSKDVELVCVGNIKHAKDYVTDRFKFDYYGISFLMDGRIALDFDGKKTELTAGSIFAYAPYSKFSMKTVSPEGCRKYFIIFTGAGAEKLLAECNISIGVPKKILNINFIQNLLEQILDCNYFAHDTACILAIDLLKVVVKILKYDAAMNPEMANDSYYTFLKCKNFIQSNFQRVNFVYEIAQACHINESYLSRFFKKHAKISPLKFLTNLKINYAKNLLVHGGMSVKAAANEVGFHDSYHFSKVFKNVCGMSPKKYAEQKRKALAKKPVR